MISSISNFSRYSITVALSVALLSISFLAATELLLRTKVVPNDHFAAHLSLFVSGTSKNVVFGDSHVARGIHGLSGFLNLSYAGDTVLEIEAKVRSYFSDKEPGKVVLQAGPQFFSVRRDDDMEFDEPRLFATKSKPYLWMFSERYSGRVINYWKRFLEGATFKSDSTIHRDGAITATAIWTDEPESQRRKLIREKIAIQRPKQAPEATRSARSYERILAFLTSRGAEVCMVGMPLPSSYRRSSASFEEFGHARAFFESLAADYRIRYLDMSAWITDDALFEDANHLNLDGALEFAPLLETACFEPYPR